MKKLLVDKKGQVTLHVAILAIVAVMLLSMVMEIYRVYHIAGMVKDETNTAVLAALSTNVSGFYGGAREGDGQARDASQSDFSYLVTTEDVVYKMAESMDLIQLDKDALEKLDNFTIMEIDVVYQNSDGQNLNFETSLVLFIELSAAGMKLPALELPLTVQSTYEAKF